MIHSVRWPAGLLLLLLLPVAPAEAQDQGPEPQVIPLDLAAPTEKRTVEPNRDFVLHLINRIPARRYVLHTTRRTIPIDPLKPPDSLAIRAMGKPLTCDNADTQLRVELAQQGLQESDVPAIRRRYRVFVESQSCSSSQKKAVRAVLADTRKRDTTIYRLERGEELIVNVQREDGASDKRWKFVLSTGPRGEWRTMYGFTFFLDRDDEFFTEAVPGAEDRFQVVEEEERNDLGFAPSVLFSWFPSARRGETWSGSLVAGLGANVESPVVFTGLGVTYNENVMITAGPLIHRQQRLDGRFTQGDTIRTNLDDDQLTEGTFVPNLYFGIAFRFGGGFDGLGGQDQPEDDETRER